MSHPIKAHISPARQAMGHVFAAAGLLMGILLSSCSGQSNNNDAGSERAVAERIQKVGSVEVRDANRPVRSGEEVFKAQCSACHATGAAGAPKFGDAAAWGPRVKQSFETLVNSALKGKGNMGAQGGGEFSDLEVARGVAYMANAGGGKFEEPKAPAAVSK